MKLIKTLLILIFSFGLCINSRGQNKEKLDSIWRAFKQARHDTVRIRLYLGAGDEFKSKLPDSAIVYYQKALDLANTSIETSSSKTKRAFRQQKANSDRENGKTKRAG